MKTFPAVPLSTSAPWLIILPFFLTGLLALLHLDQTGERGMRERETERNERREKIKREREDGEYIMHTFIRSGGPAMRYS